MQSALTLQPIAVQAFPVAMIVSCTVPLPVEQQQIIPHQSCH